MRCDQVKAILDTYNSGVCAPEEARLIEQHLKQCDLCRAEARERRRIINFLHDFGESDPPDGFHARVLLAAERKIMFDRESLFESLLRPLEWWRVAGRGLRAATLAASALGVILGGLMGSQLFNAPPGASTEGVNDERGVAQLLYGEDCLGASPEGSLLESYLALVADLAAQERER
ncbi:MAG: hypothetical protein KJ970_04340 [Candidatus Eisenbacteria bacterium]|uniref:Zinc-finger domain-containing protein n=1 Tax=Eiseniibacteriota bacterium TaxID=2212470 RepID=A0A948RUV9_UNCEI|nr:hypothetical protein [Candidatus Eisenbacteria bacterium]MBU1949869.1 hypothetical protein [Candidatus Eisenbacteria bacterium]MBU2690134.1 hypothetical protein [Candidatus Eisenbacteria bacterium]